MRVFLYVDFNGPRTITWLLILFGHVLFAVDFLKIKRLKSQAIRVLDSQIKTRLTFGAASVFIIPKHLYDIDEQAYSAISSEAI